MINPTSASVSSFSMPTRLDADVPAPRNTPNNPMDAAADAIFTMGHWDSQYTELLANALPQLEHWPRYQGLVMVEGERAERYDRNGSRSVTQDEIGDRDVIVRREGDQYIGVGLGHEPAFSQDDDGFYRAVLTGWHDFGATEPVQEHVGDLRTDLSDYVRNNWDKCKDFVAHQGQSFVGDAVSEPVSPVPAPALPQITITRTVRPFGQKPNPVSDAAGTLRVPPTVDHHYPPLSAGAKTTRAVGTQSEPTLEKRSMMHVLMDQMAAKLAPVMDVIRGSKSFNPKEMEAPAVFMRNLNRVMADTPPAQKTALIERGLQELFAGDANSTTKAQTILQHRFLPALTPVANELMVFMENAAQELKGDALTRYGQLLGVDIAQDGQDRGIAKAFAREAASGQGDAFAARFERLREEFGMAF